MRKLKFLVSFLCLCMLLTSTSGCYNNLVENWDDYTGDTDIYCHPETDETTSAKTEISYETSDAVTTEDTESNEIKQYAIPSYWKDELFYAVNEIQNCIDNAKGDYTSFFWYNDAHWSYGSQRSMLILKYLEDHTSVNITNFGGDIVSTYQVEHDENVKLLNEWRSASLILSNHHSVVGNHDDDISELENRKDLYEFLIAPELNEETDTGEFYYYVDDASQKTRYIYLTTGFEKITDAELSFIVRTMNHTPKDWHIVFVSHIWFLYFDASNPFQGSSPNYVNDVFTLIDAYNARSTGNVTEQVSYNFADAKARVEFCIGGHTHVDFDFRTSGGVPIVLTETDSYHMRGEFRDNREINESSVNVIIADYEKQTIQIVRVGRGIGRTVSLRNS